MFTSAILADGQEWADTEGGILRSCAAYCLDRFQRYQKSRLEIKFNALFFTTQSLWLLVLMGGSQVWQCQQLISLYHVWRSNKYKSLVGARNIDYFLISSTSATKSIVKTFASHAAGKGMAEWMNFELSSMRSWRTVGSPGLCS